MLPALLIAVVVSLWPVPKPAAPPEARLQLVSITTTGAGKSPTAAAPSSCDGTLDLSTGCAVPLGPIF